MKYPKEIEAETLWPVYIASKGRPDIGRFWPELEPVIVVEPQEADAYSEKNPSARFKVLPENDQGLMYVRESVRKDNIDQGWYWMLDDDISGFGVSVLGKNKPADAETVLKLAQVQAQLSGLSAIGLNYDHQSWSAKKPLKCPDTVDVCGAFNAKALQDVEFNLEMPMKGDREYCLRMFLGGLRCGTALKLWHRTQPLGKWPGGLQKEYKDGADSREAELFCSMYPGLVDLVKKESRLDARIKWRKVLGRLAGEA